MLCAVDGVVSKKNSLVGKCRLGRWFDPRVLVRAYDGPSRLREVRAQHKYEAEELSSKYAAGLKVKLDPLNRRARRVDEQYAVDVKRKRVL